MPRMFSENYPFPSQSEKIYPTLKCIRSINEKLKSLNYLHVESWLMETHKIGN